MISYHARYRETRSGPLVYIVRREWTCQGDRPDYTDILLLSASEARSLAQELLEVAERIDGQEKNKRLQKEVREIAEREASQAKKEAMG